MWGGVLANIKKIYYGACWRKLGLKLGITIANSNIGYGLVIPHYGTIVIGGGNVIGNYCVLHTSTCITAGKKHIGDGFYLSTGAKVVHDIEVSNYVSVGANSLLNKTIDRDNVMVAGCPAKIIKESEPWYIRDGEEFSRRVNECENLRKKLN